LIRIQLLCGHAFGLVTASDQDEWVLALAAQPRVVDFHRAVGADQLQEVAPGDVQPRIERREYVAGEAHRAREQEIDSVIVQSLLAVDPLWLPRDEPREVDAVAPNVHQRAALQLAKQPHIVLFGDHEALRRADQPQMTDCSGVEERLDPKSLRVMDVHEGLGKDPSRPLGGVERVLGLLA